MEGLRKRPKWNEYFLKIAMDVAERGTCKRRVYGAVIVDQDKRIISTGYCGNPHGTQNCCEIPGPCFREVLNIPSGKNYDSCHSIHAEENAIMNAGRDRVKGCNLYISGKLLSTGEEVEGKPCQKCMERIVNAGIEKVITKTKKGVEEYLVDLWKEGISQNVRDNYKEIEKKKK